MRSYRFLVLDSLLHVFLLLCSFTCSRGKEASSPFSVAYSVIYLSFRSITPGKTLKLASSLQLYVLSDTYLGIAGALWL